MKKIIVTLAVLLLAAPAMASVDIVCTPDNGANTVTVSFSTNGEAELVRALALDIQFSDPNVWIEDINCAPGTDAGYNIHPSNIDISPGGVVDDYGSCAGEEDTNSMTSEQGSLYVGLPSGPNAPDEGDLFIITLGGCTLDVSGDVAITISENVLRGKVVMEDVSNPGTVNLTGCSLGIGECPPPPDPSCPCPGDVDGNTFINTSDLGQLITQLTAAGAPYIIPSSGVGDCRDYDGNGFINTSDLGQLITALTNAGAPYIISCP